MKFIIVKIEKKVKGKLYRIKAEDKELEIMITWYAIERINRWKLKIELVIEDLLYPEEVLVGHHNRYIAHKRYGNHLVRAIYEYDDHTPIVVTVYFPLSERYFKGGGMYADKIFS